MTNSFLHTFFVICLVAVASVQASNHSGHDLQTKFFNTFLDHLTPTDQRTVNMTYVEMSDYHIENGPLFVYVPEGDRSTNEFLQSGLMHDIAAEVGAALITADLRYFHSNLPTADVSFENLQYLTVEQIIHDIARLVQAARVNLELTSTNSRVILWGRGLGAALATYTRQKFPHLIDGVWSSSGVYAPVVHTSEPYEHLARQIAKVGGEQCGSAVEQAFEALEVGLLYAGESFDIYERFGLCSPPYGFYDEELGGFFAGAIQLIADQINEQHSAAITDLCDTLLAAPIQVGEPGHAAFGRWVRNHYSDRVRCLDLSYYSRLYDNIFEHWDNVTHFSWSPEIHMVWPHVSRPQMFLTCNQLGRTLTTVNSASRTFGHQVGQDLLFYFCSDVFREGGYRYEELAEAVRALELGFGGVRPRVTRVLYTNGELDILLPFGILEPSTTSKDEIVLTISGQGQSADLYSARADDAKELAQAKETIRRVIREWVGVLPNKSAAIGSSTAPTVFAFIVIVVSDALFIT